jgi:hypothetical protein
MTGDDVRRHCAHCDREVLHLSAMTAEAAQQALASRPGERVCVRYCHDADDNIVFAAPRAGALRAAALATSLAACTAGEPRSEDVAAAESVVAPALPELCDEEPTPIVDTVECADPSLPIYLPGDTIAVEVDPVLRSDVSMVTKVNFDYRMGLPIGRVEAVAPPLLSMPSPAPAPASQAAAPQHPRRALPLETRMGALAPVIAIDAPRFDREQPDAGDDSRD